MVKNGEFLKVWGEGRGRKKRGRDRERRDTYFCLFGF